MRDQNSRIAPPQTAERRHEFLFCQTVQSVRRLVEHKDACCPIQRARNADSLPLTAAQLDASLTHPMAAACGEGINELIELRQASRFQQPVSIYVRGRNSQCNVL